MMQAVTRARRIRQRTWNLETPVETMVEVKEEDTAEMVTPLAQREVITATTIICRPRTGTRRMIATQADENMQAKEATEIKLLAEEDDSVAEMTKINVKGRCNYCHNSTEHCWHDCPLRLSHQQSDDIQHANAALVGAAEGTISHAWCTQIETTENANLESFQVVVGNDAECSRSRDKMYHGENTQV